jgi:AbiV family abortive infection protein
VKERSDVTASMKEAKRRMLPFFRAVAELANEDEPIGTVTSAEEAVTAYRNLVYHCEELWHDASTMFLAGRVAPALFFAIVCIEETAKVAVARLQAHAWDGRKANEKRPRDLRSHRRKHWLAVCAGAVVNSRMDRIFGIERVNAFMKLVEDEGLERVRQSALYSDLVGGRQHLPYRETRSEDARFYVAVAGELLAEATDLVEDWTRIVDAVSRFEIATGTADAEAAHRG